MDFFQVKMKIKSLPVAAILLVYLSFSTAAHNTEYLLDERAYSELAPRIVTLDHVRQKRAAAEPAPPAPAPAAVPEPASPAPASPAPASPAQPEPTNATASANVTVSDDSNRTTVPKSNVTETLPPTVVTQVPPFLGANGTGQRWPNATDKVPKVSDPISPSSPASSDDLPTDIYESPERIQAEQHLSNLTYDNHDFYNSTFIGNLSYFEEYWGNISKAQAGVHSMLSNSHRRATTMQLSFKFPFYGNWIQSITVATGGFVYIGEHTHSWLAATQYIAPLMANFDTSLTNDSNVKLSDDGEKFTAFWENVNLRESPNKPFTFAVTLYKNGDIVFAYKNVPIKVQDIDDSAHPVKIGISDAYLTDRVIFYVRRKTIFEYHRVSFKNYEISNNTILRLTALPTCLQYDSCDGCVNHNTSFECSWCENIRKCSSGMDRNKQDWKIRNCDKVLVTNSSMCPVGPATGSRDSPDAYVTDQHTDQHRDIEIGPTVSSDNTKPKDAENSAFQSPVQGAAAAPHSSIGGAVAALLAVTLVCSAAAWVLYAFKNPHTRSGQMLIKYRPSQWSWRRGEARYTAATIHM